MTDPLPRLLRAHKGRQILVDTNILLLYFVGVSDVRLITKFKRTQQFTVEDFKLLLRLFKWFGPIVTTPNILTEVNNLAGQLSSGYTRIWRSHFQSSIASLHEEYIPAHLASANPSYLKCGLTDAGLLEISRRGLLVLTDDLQLFISLQSESIDAINFNHVRTMNWLW